MGGRDNLFYRGSSITKCRRKEKTGKSSFGKHQNSNKCSKQDPKMDVKTGQ